MNTYNDCKKHRRERGSAAYEQSLQFID